jgi:hypothetical protein
LAGKGTSPLLSLHIDGMSLVRGIRLYRVELSCPMGDYGV